MESSGFLLILLVFFAVFATMELVAYLTHRYVMHGFLWAWHRSHHRPESAGKLEGNDAFGLFFAAISIALFYFGSQGQPLLSAAGAGMLAYGVLYFVLHDMLVHKRVGQFAIPRKGYLRRVYQSHRIHHGTRDKHGAVSFGFAIPASDRQLSTWRLERRKLRERQ